MPLVKSHKEWVGVLLAFAAVVAIACGGSATATLPPTATSTPSPTATPATNASTQTGATTPGAELTAEEAAYIEQVRAGWNEFHSKAGGFREAFGQLYEMKSRLFETLEDAGAGSAFEGALRAVEEIEPPQRFHHVPQLHGFNHMIQLINHIE